MTSKVYDEATDAITKELLGIDGWKVGPETTYVAMAYKLACAALAALRRLKGVEA
jgi:hypothetical protein